MLEAVDNFLEGFAVYRTVENCSNLLYILLANE